MSRPPARSKTQQEELSKLLKQNETPSRPGLQRKPRAAVLSEGSSIYVLRGGALLGRNGRCVIPQPNRTEPHREQLKHLTCLAKDPHGPLGKFERSQTFSRSRRSHQRPSNIEQLSSAEDDEDEEEAASLSCGGRGVARPIVKCRTTAIFFLKNLLDAVEETLAEAFAETLAEAFAETLAEAFAETLVEAFAETFAETFAAAEAAEEALETIAAAGCCEDPASLIEREPLDTKIFYYHLDLTCKEGSRRVS